MAKIFGLHPNTRETRIARSTGRAFSLLLCDNENRILQQLALALRVFMNSIVSPLHATKVFHLHFKYEDRATIIVIATDASFSVQLFDQTPVILEIAST